MNLNKGMRCTRWGCGHAKTGHAVNMKREYVGDDGRVSPGFEKVIPGPGRKSQSFSSEEMALLWQMMKAIQRGGDTSVVTRSPVLGSLAKKIHKMALKKKVEA